MRQYLVSQFAIVAIVWLLLSPRLAAQQLGNAVAKLDEPTQAFDLSALKRDARLRALQAYQPPADHLPPPIAHLTWDQMQAIRFQDGHSLWRDDNLQFRLKFFHLGLYNKLPVQMFEVTGGRARRLAYDPTMFDYGTSGVDGKVLPKDWASPVFSC